MFTKPQLDQQRFRVPPKVDKPVMLVRPAAPLLIRAVILDANGALQSVLEAEEDTIRHNVPEGGSWHVLDYSGDLKALFSNPTSFLAAAALFDPALDHGGQHVVQNEILLSFPHPDSQEVTSDDNAAEPD